MINSLSRQLTTSALAIAAPSSFVGKKTMEAMNQIKPALKMVSLGGILLSSSLLFTPTAQSAVVACPNTAKLSTFISLGSCQDADIDGNLGLGDKIYTIDSALTTNEFTWRNGNVSLTTDVGDIHRLAYQRVGTLPWTAFNNTFTLAYTIEVSPSATNFFFDSISIGVDVPNAQRGISTKLQVWTDTFNGASPITGTPATILNSGQAGDFDVFPNIKKLYVINTITRTNTANGSTANISQFTNTFVQKEIPEPSMILGILAVAGVGAASRFRWK